MATPNLKLLLNALRLGQPQDPKAVAFVLGEAIAAQDEVIEELRRRLGMAIQQTQILEVKTNRLEAELGALRAISHPSGGETESKIPRPLGEREREAHEWHGSQPPGNYNLPPSTHTPQPELRMQQQQHQHQHPYAQAPASVRPASARPPPPAAPVEAPPVSHRPASQPPAPLHRSQPPQAMHRSQPPPAGSGSAGLRLGRDSHHEASPHHDPYPSEDSSDGLKTETVVVRREDVLAAHLPEAPFQITPAGARIPPNVSIPGAPWARERGQRVQVPMDEYTIDASSMPRDSSEDLDGETFATPHAPPKERPRTVWTESSLLDGVQEGPTEGHQPAKLVGTSRTTPRIAPAGGAHGGGHGDEDEVAATSIKRDPNR